MSTDEQIDRLLGGPVRAIFEVRDEDGKELNRPLEGLFGAVKESGRYSVWQYHPEVGPGTPGGAAYHLVGAYLLPDEQEDGTVVLRGTWTNAVRGFVPDAGGVLCSMQYTLGEPVQHAVARVTLLSR